MPERGERREQAGWRFEFPPGPVRLSDAERDGLIGLALAAIDDGRWPDRRSRHAATYRLNAGAGSDSAQESFVKVYDSPRGPAALKHLIRGSRAAHSARVSAALAARGFAVARVILFGHELASAAGRAMLVTERAQGASVAAFLGGPGRPGIARKREVLRALGAEVARLHRSGYIHGDLTPYNVFLADSTPASFVFIDHDRTRRAFAVGRRRRQLRNLVQLFRFDLPRLTRADRMRVFQAWARGLKLRRRNLVMRRTFNMLKIRIARDLARAPAGAAPLNSRATGTPIAAAPRESANRAG